MHKVTPQDWSLFELAVSSVINTHITREVDLSSNTRIVATLGLTALDPIVACRIEAKLHSVFPTALITISAGHKPTITVDFSSAIEPLDTNTPHNTTEDQHASLSIPHFEPSEFECVTALLKDAKSKQQELQEQMDAMFAERQDLIVKWKAIGIDITK